MRPFVSRFKISQHRSHLPTQKLNRIKPALVLLGLPWMIGCGGGASLSPAETSTGRQLKTLLTKGVSGGTFTVTDLGATWVSYPIALAGSYSPYYGLSRYSGAISINKSGQIVSSGTGNAAIYSGGTLTKLSQDYSAGNALNDAGLVVGWAYLNASPYGQYAFAWQANGAATNLGSLAGSYYSSAYGVSNSGLVAGDALTANNAVFHAVLWTGSAPTDLGTLPNGDSSHAQGVNDAGQVAGWSTIANSSNGDYRVHAFLWQNGKMTDLSTLPGGTSSDVSSINAGGQVVGSSNTAPQGLYANQPVRATLWDGGGIHDLGTLGGPGSIAWATNAANAVAGAADTTTLQDQSNVPIYYPLLGGSGGTGGNAPPPVTTGGATGAASGGTSANGSKVNPILGGAGRSARGMARTRGIGDIYVTHAFLYFNSQMNDLNTLIDPASGWELLTATGINDSNQIVGYGLLNKRLHAFLLTPK